MPILDTSLTQEELEGAIVLEPIRQTDSRRDFNPSNDNDWVQLVDEELNVVQMRPKRFIGMEIIQDVRFGKSRVLPVTYGPYNFSNLIIDDDRSGWSFVVDCRTYEAPDDQYELVFQQGSAYASFWVAYHKLGNMATRDKTLHKPPKKKSQPYAIGMSTLDISEMFSIPERS